MMSVPKAGAAKHAKARPPVSDAELLMAAATMHQLGRLTKPGVAPEMTAPGTEAPPPINMEKPTSEPPPTPAGETPTPTIGIRG